MNTQITKKVFIASSSEMHHERLVLVDLFTDMSTEEMYYQPVKWEYVDKALRVERKEDQYLRRLRDCDVCVTMFWKTLGKYTAEEFEDAIKEQKLGNNIKKVLVLVKKDSSDVDESLTGFLSNIEKEYGCTPVSFYDDTQLKTEVVKFLFDVEGRSDADQPIREINVMITGLNELDEDKLEFTDMMAHLNDALIKKGIRLRRIKCQDNLDEFKMQVSGCYMCINVYWRELPKGAKDAVSYAYTELKSGNNPQNWHIFFKETDTDKDIVSEALLEFKASIEAEYEHFFCKYENVDTMNLNFVLELMTMQNGLDDTMISNKEGRVFVGNMPMIDIGNLRFAKLNENYQRMSNNLVRLSDEIEKARINIERYPDVTPLKQRLQELLDEYNKLQKEFDQHQQFLFDVAKRISQIKRERITDCIKRAIKAFEDGDVERANIILDEALEGAEHYSDDFQENIKPMRQSIFNYIDGFLLSISTIMADANQPIDNRVTKAKQIYSRVEELAEKAFLEKKRYIEFLGEYAMFMVKHVVNREDYEKAIDLNNKRIAMAMWFNGELDLIKADSYDSLGCIYKALRDYTKSIESDKNAFKIRKAVLGPKHAETAKYYNNIGLTYSLRGRKGDYEKALKNYKKAIELWELNSKSNSAYLISVYGNLGKLIIEQWPERWSEAIDYELDAVELSERLYGEEHIDTAGAYYDMGYVVYNGSDNKESIESSLKWFFKAFRVFSKKCGLEQLSSMNVMESIGVALHGIRYYNEAIAFLNKVLEVNKKVECLTDTDIEAIQTLIDDSESRIDETLGTEEQISFYDWEKTADDWENIADDFINYDYQYELSEVVPGLEGTTIVRL